MPGSPIPRPAAIAPDRRPDRRSARYALQISALAILVFLLASGSVALTRFDGGAAFIWAATAPLLAFLATRPPREWTIPLGACGLAWWLASSIFGLGPVAAIPLALAATTEALVAAVGMRGGVRKSTVFDSLASLGRFTLAAGIIAPAASGLIAGLTIAAHTGQHFWPNFWAWFAAHGLGTISFAPLLLLLSEREGRLWAPNAKSWRRIEAFVLLIVVALVSFLVFYQESMPLLFLPMLPILLTTFRLGRLGAAASVVLLAVIGGVLTLKGHGPVSLVHASSGERAQFFQFFLAVTVMMMLSAAAELKQRHALMSRSLESEARYRLLAENLGDTMIQTSIEGEVLFASPAIFEMTGYDVNDVIGRNSSDFVVAEDYPLFVAARARAINDSDATISLEYRASIKADEIIWCETRMRSYVDGDGIPIGIILVVRDASARKDAETRLSLEATTDSLTGLPNRRAFMKRMDELRNEARSDANSGCIALLDVDFFKRVNDDHGHATGDLVLQTIALAARKALRSSDMIARVGGEEFGVVLWGTSIAQATATCERIRAAVADCRVQSPAGVDVLVTASLGIAVVKPGLSSIGVYERADRMLYEAKAKGRNRVLIAA